MPSSVCVSAEAANLTGVWQQRLNKYSRSLVHADLWFSRKKKTMKNFTNWTTTVYTIYSSKSAKKSKVVIVKYV